MFLGMSFLWDSGAIVSIRLLCTLLLAVRSFLVVRSIGFLGSFLATYALHSLERQKEQTNVDRSPTFLVNVVLVLPCIGAHSKNMTNRSASAKGTFMGIVFAFTLRLWYQQGSCKM